MKSLKRPSRITRYGKEKESKARAAASARAKSVSQTPILSHERLGLSEIPPKILRVPQSNSQSLLSNCAKDLPGFAIEKAIDHSLLPVSIWTGKGATDLVFKSLAHQELYTQGLDRWEADLLKFDAEEMEADYLSDLCGSVKSLFGKEPAKFKGRIRQPLKAIAFFWLLVVVAIPVAYLWLFNDTMGNWNRHHSRAPLPDAPTAQSIVQPSGKDFLSLGTPSIVLTLVGTKTPTRTSELSYSHSYTVTSTPASTLPVMTPAKIGP